MTLYEKLRKIEGTSEEYKTFLDQFKEFQGYDETLKGYVNSIDISKAQKKIMDECRENCVFADALKGVKSIEDSLKELGDINYSIKKHFFSDEKRTYWDERIKATSELINSPNYMQFTTLTFGKRILKWCGTAFASTYLLGTVLSESNLLHPDPELITISTFLGLMVGFPPAFLNFAHNSGNWRVSYNYELIGEAKYLDDKIKKLYLK